MEAYAQRLEILKASGVWWREVEPQRLVAGGAGELRELVEALELEWNAGGVGELIKPRHWHAGAVAEPRPSPAIVRPTAAVIANSVPKSGTHLLGKTLSLLGVSEIPVRLYANMGARSLQVEETAGKVAVGGIWPSLVRFEELSETLLGVRSGQYIQGHLPYSERVARLIEAFGLRMVLILRDPRAVAVSQVRWAMSREYLPAYELFKSISGGERLRLAITGYCIEPEGPVAQSLRRRYEQMLSWMSHANVYTTRFERLAGPESGGDREAQLEELRNIAAHIGMEVGESALERVAQQLYGGTMTFKGGRIDRWREEFTEEHKALMKEQMGDLILKLGYEQDDNW